jgi:hypothetical protein
MTLQTETFGQGEKIRGPVEVGRDSMVSRKCLVSDPSKQSDKLCPRKVDLWIEPATASLQWNTGAPTEASFASLASSYDKT